MNLYLFVVFTGMLSIATVKGGPDVIAKGSDQLLPILVQKIDERDLSMNTEDARPQKILTENSQNVDSKVQAMKKLLDILGLQVRFYSIAESPAIGSIIGLPLYRQPMLR